MATKKLCWYLLLQMLCKMAVAQPKDTLYLMNGQVLIGELKSIVLGKADFDADDIDIVSIKSDKIKTLKAITHLFRLETIHRKIFYTLLLPAGDGKINVKIGEEQQDISIQDISHLIPLRGKTGALWEGNVSSGYTYSRSSNVGQFNADASVGYSSRKIELLSQGSIIMSQTDSSFDINNANLDLIGSYLFTPVWQGIILANYQRNLELGLARRYQEGVAAGLSFLSTVHMRAKVITGVVFNQEKNTEGDEKPTQLEIPFIIVFNFFRFRKPDMALSSTQRLFVGVTQKGRLRHDGSINLSWKIIKDLSVNVKLYDNYDNQPPGVDAATLDFGVVFGLSYKFSQ